MENTALVSAVVLGLVAVLKVAGVKSNYLPACGVVLGIALSFMVADVTVVSGIIAALTASGLYSGTKATIK